MPSRLIQANERKHPKQAIHAIHANDQRPVAAPAKPLWIFDEDKAC